MSVRNDVELLQMMLQDMQAQQAVWRPQARWAEYATRIADVLKTQGLDGFRESFLLLKGIAAGGVRDITPPSSGLKRVVWDQLNALPGVDRIVREYQRLLRAYSRSLIDTEICLSRLAMDVLAASFPDLRIPSGLDSGGSARGFTWRDQTLTSDWCPFVARAADCYARFPVDSVSSILEIGPGLGHSTLAHWALNCKLKVVANVDIPPVLYLATQFLKAIPELDIVDYRDTRTEHRIELTPSNDGRLRVYALAPWQVDKIDGVFDLTLNAASFQEMTPEICKAYAAEIVPRTRRAVMLHCGDPRDLQMQTKVWRDTTISPTDLVGLFSAGFPSHEIIDNGHSMLFPRDSYVPIIMSRPEPAGATSNLMARP